MTRRGRWLCAAILMVALLAHADVGTWRNFTSMKEVRAIVRSGATYWAATNGGLFQWDPSTDSYQRLTNAEGLRSIDLTAITMDSRGTIWVGSSTGFLHTYTPSTGSIRTIQDIAEANQTNKRINALTVVGDTVLICTDFGLSIFRISKFEFGDTYSRFGSGSTTTRTAVYAATIFDKKIWAAISDGQTVNQIAVAQQANPNLLPPESWTLQVVGSPSTVPKTLTEFSGRLYSGTSNGLYFFDGSAWSPLTAFAGKSVTATSAAASRLLAATSSSEIFSVTPQHDASAFTPGTPYPPTSVGSDSAGKPVVGTTGGGILTYSPSWVSHVPNGPNSNQFINLTVDLDGVLWCGSGDLSGYGLYRYDGVQWTSFTTQNSALPWDQVHRVSTACDGSVWASTYGRGVVEIPRGVARIDSSRIYGRNVGMVGIPNDLSYIVVSNVVCDSKKNAWMTVVLAADKNLLVMRRNDGQWFTFPVIFNGIKMSNLQDRPVDHCLAIDANDNLWMAIRDPAYKGIGTLGNAGTLDSTIAYQLTTANGLPSNEAKTLVMDRDNDLWVGTDRGIALVLNVANPGAKDAIARYRPLSGQVINCIAVDPLNQKWVGTTDGAFLLSADGTQTIASYTVESTSGKLMENDVKSIAVDERTGTVYFGTNAGLASLTTPAAAPQQSFTELTVYPNPYFLPNPTPLNVSGLVQNSSLKILSIDGRVVRSLRTPGGLVGFWDGKDDAGEDVSSGVYIIVAYAEDGSTVANGKVAVIKH